MSSKASELDLLSTLKDFYLFTQEAGRIHSTYLFPAFVHAIILSKTRISWKLRKIRGKFETRNPVTMATKVIASLSSALRLRMLLLLPPGTDFKDALK